MSKKSNRSNPSKASTKLQGFVPENSEVKNGNAKFGFRNGDIYEGEFGIENGKNIFKQGHGVYVTDNFDVYTAQWDRDYISTDLHIQYNNGMQYKGGINVNGEMNGLGTYIFPDSSSVEGTWNKNKPIVNTNFVEPLGYKWKGLNSDIEKEILFIPGNHFWKELYGAENKNEDEIILNEDVSIQRINSKISFKSKKRLTSKK
ncbi:phosphatidylinositol 4-phosphate 5-kinase 4-like isoform X1 [Belonocnema kinseyi]|uniref:phosphatidylinositol 4-phosphate 5-kinase 4-like isoform X1 n=1 Tax=Belonocnema kinseyi TaxID=2817044 RepID=UPI00143D2699|nr:phosphatidylinositol 4-phosphate 5-kinase 4-like isoform X1 [Belonocnema kinseyi]